VEPGITVHLDEVGGLAAQLSALAAELDEDARTCRSAAGRVREALGGEEGWRAGALAIAWASLAETVAGRAGAVAASLVSATVAYRANEASLAERMTGTHPERPR
jgi:hypothetical protein